jgi:hypothetical protein
MQRQWLAQPQFETVGAKRANCVWTTSVRKGPAYWNQLDFTNDSLFHARHDSQLNALLGYAMNIKVLEVQLVTVVNTVGCYPA